MCVQEAAWFLLRLPMSEASRQVFFIPTQHPSERLKCKKTRQQMNKEDISAESTDVWKKNIIERYEERPTEFENVTLADFVANYDRVETRTLNDNMMRGDEELFDEENEEEDTDYVNGVITDSSIVRVTYRKRKKNFVRDGGDTILVNDQDINTIQRETVVRTVKSAMSHEEFCAMTTVKNGEEYVSRVWLLFDDPACGEKIRLKCQQHMVEHRIDLRYTPFVRRELPINMKSRIIKVKRRQFSLLPSNAQTIHKVQ
ncbi:unnamed protein product [Chilo suppressalis]|uniref:Uncharacterized protein n=1 Tax=Chilo suppressalis TaxID=168631 RepID=A0ABN8B2G4_CHISP|nr:unnamed protein product [Chilo suppressalis]